MFAYMAKLLPYLRVTFAYLLIALAIGLIFGFLLAAAKLGKNRVLRGLAVGYTAIMRSLPSIVLLFLVYYGIPKLAQGLFGVKMNGTDKLVFVSITLGLLSIASLSEIMKSAYRAVDPGQREAATSNGLTESQAFFRIILPQAFRIAIPNLGNTVVVLLKEGSLGYTIGLMDVMGGANQLNALTYQNNILEIFFGLALIYWILSIIIDKLFQWWERAASTDARDLKTPDTTEEVAA